MVSLLLIFLVSVFPTQVEVWLNRLMDTSRSTVRNQFNEGVNTYEEKPREQWLYDFPAQVALASTQVWWSTEVNIAFARLEEGHENALKEYNKKQVWRYIWFTLTACFLLHFIVQYM